MPLLSKRPCRRPERPLPKRPSPKSEAPFVETPFAASFTEAASQSPSQPGRNGFGILRLRIVLESRIDFCQLLAVLNACRAHSAHLRALLDASRSLKALNSSLNWQKSIFKQGAEGLAKGKLQVEEEESIMERKCACEQGILASMTFVI